jgi:drug/metabolite transporter (DMT)-like permease
MIWNFNMRIQPRWSAATGLALAAMLWGSSFVVLKAAMNAYHPYMLTLGRMVVAAIFFLPFLYLRRRTWPYHPGSWKIILFMSLCEPCLYFLLEVEALRRTSASQAGMVTAMLPLMAAFGSFLFFHERLGRRTFIGFVLAITGVCWLSLSGRADSQAPNPVLGNFLEFCAMLCSTGYFLSVKHLTVRYGYSPFWITGVQALAGMLFFIPLLWLPAVDVRAHMELDFFLAIGYLGAFITMGAYGLYNFGISRMPVGQAAAFINLIPVFAVFWGWLLLGERFSHQQYAAASMILAGVYLSRGLSPGGVGHGGPARPGEAPRVIGTG